MPCMALQRGRWVSLSVTAVGTGAAGCGGLEPVAPYTDTTANPELLYIALTLDHPALNLSTAPGYETWQLTATPRNAAGGAMSGLPTPTWLSKDTTAVWVTQDGLVTARKATSAAGVQVIAEMIAPGNIRHADTAVVTVKALPTPPKTLTIDPLAPDSAFIAMPGMNITSDRKSVV